MYSEATNITAQRGRIAKGSEFQLRVTPDIQLSTLPNGVRVVSEYLPTARSFALGIWVNAGSRDESPAQSGIAHFIEHAVFRRSASRTSRQIASQFESLGAYLNAFTSKEQTCYYVRALSPHFASCIEMLSDVVLHPAFRDQDVEKERSVIAEEIKSYEDEAEEHILDIGERIVFAAHQLGSPIAGSVQSVSDISSNDLRSFHQQHYTAPNILIAVAGSISHERILDLSKQLFGTLQKSRAVQRRAPRQVKPKVLKLSRSFQQSHVLFVRRTNGVRSKDRHALSLLNTILGDGMSSRLHQQIREKTGAAYSLYSSLQLLSDCGVISVYAACDSKTLARTETLIARELSLMIHKKISRSELARAKEQLKSSTIMALESMSARMNSLAKSEMEEGKIEDVSRFINAIDAVDEKELMRVADDTFNPDSWSRVVIESAASSKQRE